MTDLLHQDEVRDAVAATYASLGTGAGRRIAERHYDAEELAAVPDRAVAWALGVGNPVRRAELRPGEVVLDLGCGGGIDVVLAARLVGPAGRVIGLDMLPAMCERTAQAAAEAGVADRCEVREGIVEALPLPDDAVDVVLANGVLNLSPRKSRALAEAARVLRPGGRLCAADLVVDLDLPPEVLGSPAVWAGCLAGALSEPLLRRKLLRAGFAEVRSERGGEVGVDDLAAYPVVTPAVRDLLRRLLPPAQQRAVATSVVVRAAVPAAGAAPAGSGSAQRWRTAVAHLDQIPPDAVEAPGVVVRHLLRVDDVELKVLDVEAGGSTPYHTHAHAHEGLVVSGTGSLRLADRVEPLRPGSTFAVAPTARHAVRADPAGPLRFACMDCLVG